MEGEWNKRWEIIREWEKEGWEIIKISRDKLENKAMMGEEDVVMEIVEDQDLELRLELIWDKEEEIRSIISKKSTCRSEEENTKMLRTDFKLKQAKDVGFRMKKRKKLKEKRRGGTAKFKDQDDFFKNEKFNHIF